MSFLQSLIRRKVWKMDIHPSARIARTAYVDRTYPRGVHIEEGVRIEEEAVILTHDMTRGIYKHTRIGARTVVGPRAIVLPGVTVGADCYLMPGAVVIADVPASSTAQGNPAVVTPRQAA